MAIDMSQFQQMYFEESFEGLGAMESGLLLMAAESDDAGDIDMLFRAVHSIKGASATFGFDDIADFSHDMETLLDQMRQGRRPAGGDTLQALLQAVDLLKQMLAARRDALPLQDSRVSAARQVLQSMLTDDLPQKPVQATAAERFGQTTWHILFRPLSHMMRTGNDPLRQLRELAAVGDLTVATDTSGLPQLAQMDPECCYLHWDMRLRGALDRSAIEDIFDWVEGDCELRISPLGQQPAATAAEAESEAPALDRRQRPADDARALQSPATERVVDAADKGRQAVGGEPPGSGLSKSIRVDLEKIDALVNGVGELAISQSMLSVMAEDLHAGRLERLQQGLAQIARHTRDLQDNVMQIRMLPIGFTFNRFKRLVHDLSVKLGKQIELEIQGAATELDKTVIEKLADPLVHLVRNSIDHGIETPAERRAAGKPETGRLRLTARHQAGRILVEVRDDGKGLDREAILSRAISAGLVDGSRPLSDREVLQLVVQAGFSTASRVSDLSGRGVGLDVVAGNIHALGGDLEIESEPGRGTAVVLRLPLTLAVLDGQILRVGGECYIVPLVAIVQSVQPAAAAVKRLAGNAESFRMGDEYLPVVRLYEVFGVERPVARHPSEGLLVVLQAEGMRCALMVDDLACQQQLVIKSLAANYRPVDGVSAATILTDGSVALILDVPAIMRLAGLGAVSQVPAQDRLQRQTGWQ